MHGLPFCVCMTNHSLFLPRMSFAGGCLCNNLHPGSEQPSPSFSFLSLPTDILPSLFCLCLQLCLRHIQGFWAKEKKKKNRHCLPTPSRRVSYNVTHHGWPHPLEDSEGHGCARCHGRCLPWLASSHSLRRVNLFLGAWDHGALPGEDTL